MSRRLLYYALRDTFMLLKGRFAADMISSIISFGSSPRNPCVGNQGYLSLKVADDTGRVDQVQALGKARSETGG